MSELEIILWVHSGWITECRVTAILWAPPILWIPFRLDLKWISRIFQLYLSDFHFPHFRAPPICDFGSAHWKKQNICRVFPLYLSDFNVCIFELFIHYPVRTSHVDCHYYKWKQINVLELWVTLEFQVYNPTCSQIDVQAALREGHHLAAPGKWILGKYNFENCTPVSWFLVPQAWGQCFASTMLRCQW